MGATSVHGVDDGDCWGTGPFGAALREWAAVPGGFRADGSTVTKPAELAEADLVLGLMERFGYTYEELMEGGTEVFRLVQIQSLGHPERTEGGESWQTM